MKHKVQTALLILIIILSALFGSISQVEPVAMKRESRQALEGEIIEGRSIFITRYDRKCNSWVEVLEV